MDWQALGAIGETVGAVAVVVSIVYLSIQIRANTEATKARAGFDATHSWADINSSLAGKTDNELALLVSAMNPSADWDSYTHVERQRLVLMTRSVFQRLEGQYFLYRHGYLDDELFENRARWASGALRLPFYAKWWEAEKTQRAYSSAFIRRIESVDPLGDVEMR